MVRQESPEKIREYRLRHLYGIDLADYNRILANQGGGCAICDGKPSGPGEHLHVDHCHDTGQVRGLLCDACNKGLGGFGDSRETLLSAIAYLKSVRGAGT